ncbi:BlaI/MecI/CopY family transcriptional regulator [Sphingomonas sp. URHD0057]|uniref:BlaI/MecI/CopY family transcriptional regulator n=1 Tax=Sphingomonas sp. URHD0057 TaxID=1380389 RepID=UPI00048F717C|nr:BlaI/MecI/CopY family transcriptional regulator [Sphingomonas sp. URHD0057]
MIDKLPRRERELFEILCSVREASAAEIRARLADPPSYSAVRTMLSRLEARGLVTHRADDQTYIYSTVPQPAKVRRSALNKFIETFFEGSPASAATALLGMSKKLTDNEVEALQRAIDAAKERK